MLVRQSLFTLKKRTHHFVVCNITAGFVKGACITMAKRLIQYKLTVSHGVATRQADKVYASSNTERTWFRFHINHFDEFMKIIHDLNITPEMYTLEETPIYTPAVVEWKLKTDKSAYDYQQAIIDDYLIPEKPRSKLITFQTGKGKGLTLQLTTMQLKSRLLLQVKGMYCVKWEEEMKAVFDLKDDDVCVIRGAQSLQKLIEKAKEGCVRPKVIIMSLTTYQIWLNAYEDSELAASAFACAPDELCELLGIGIKAVDEVHMHFHQVFKGELYTHVPKSIAMSATLFNKDTFLRKMYEVMFPLLNRYKEMELDQYVDVTAVFFQYKDYTKIRTSPYGSTFFNSGSVEQSIMRHIPTLKNWLNLIGYTVDLGFMQITRPKKKLLIFAYLEDTINLIVGYLQDRYPQFVVNRFMGGDPLSNVMDSDICVSTVGSAGTALDLQDLTNVIMARDMSSAQANVQLLGRLRRLPDKYPVAMHYLVASNLEKSMSYNEEKRKLFADRVRSQSLHYSGITV